MIFLWAAAISLMAQTAQYIDPRIGSEGLGRVALGPAMPFGMIRPSADATSMPNSGWAPMPETLRGFAQVHVSGTGGGQKYGNILLMPFAGPVSDQRPLTMTNGDGWNISRLSETALLGYYSCTLDNNINVEISATDRAAIYKFQYPKGSQPGLAVDAGFFLGYSPIPDQRETQQLVGSQIEIISDYEIRGYNRVRGGWNNGRAYTVYFYAIADKPFTKTATWKSDVIYDDKDQVDSGELTGTLSITLADTISVLPPMRAGHAIKSKPTLDKGDGKWKFTFKLHGQTRRYEVDFVQRGDSLLMLWGIERNLQWQSGSMAMGKESLQNGTILNSTMPVDGEQLKLPAYETAYVLSTCNLDSLKTNGTCRLNGDIYQLIDLSDGLLHARGHQEGGEIWVLDDPVLPIVVGMSNNPLEINWQATSIQ